MMRPAPVYCALGLSIMLASGLTWSSPASQPSTLFEHEATAPVSATPTRLVCPATPTLIPAAVVPGRYSIFLAPPLHDSSVVASQLAQAYRLTDISVVLPYDTSFS